MSFYIFLCICVIVNMFLSVFVQMKHYSRPLTYSLFGLAIIFPVNAILGHWLQPLLGESFATNYPFIVRLYFATSIGTTLLLMTFVKGFLREEEISKASTLLTFNISIFVLLRIIGCIAILACLVLPMSSQNIVNGEWYTEISFFGVGVIIIQLLLVLYSLFVIENTYRFSQGYQRRIARFCLLTLLIILVFQGFSLSSLLLYKIVDLNLVVIASVIYGVTFPVLLIGLIRYRLASERISISRNSVFSTITLLLSGAVFLGIGITAFVFQQFDISFNYFEEVLLLFSVSLFAVLLIGSGTMRKRISLFVNNLFYTQKFDYREQFFNLHRSYMTGENVDSTLTEIIENMKYSIAAEDAFIFIIHENDGHFYMHENKESATASNTVIRGDSKIILELSQNFSPINLHERTLVHRFKNVDIGEKIVAETLKADMLFPITNRTILLGFLALRLNKEAKIDSEDKILIEAFANSIGDILFKNKVLTERVERKQFESFSHMSSFIIHDIKNQAATISLLARNAKSNIANPDFQKSLLLSLESCTGNLQSLIDKLKSPPKLDTIKMRSANVNDIVDRVIENTGLATMGQQRLVVNKGLLDKSDIDEDSLFYTIKNLIVNAIEAMTCTGTLTISTGKLSPAPQEILNLFDPGKDFFTPFKQFIMVSDTGKGMPASFVESKLFHPFVTTKDKGIGIGLYQCKTLIEKMGGKILCHSEVGKGTDFCILL